MPLGTTNGNYECDGCGKPMPIGTEAWIDLEENKIYCLSCKTEDGEGCFRELSREEPDAPLPSGPKTVVVRHESSKVEDLKKENAALKKEIKQLSKDMAKLRSHSKELLGILQKMQGKKVKRNPTLEEAYLMLKQREQKGPNNRCD